MNRLVRLAASVCVVLAAASCGAPKSMQQTAPRSEVSSSVGEEIPFRNLENNPVAFQLVDVKPTFRGGDANEFSKYVNTSLVYPAVAKKKGIQGRVILQFVINTDGSLTDIKVLRGCDPLLDAEAVRVVQNSPSDWTPGEYKGRMVPVSYVFPVIFQLR